MAEETYTEQDFDALWSEGDLAGTEVALRAFNLKVKATGNPYLLVQLLSRIARAQIFQDKFEAAQESLNEADYVLIEAAKRDTHEHPLKHRAWLRYLRERARFFEYVGWEENARTMLEDAREMARGTGQLDLLKEFHHALGGAGGS